MQVIIPNNLTSCCVNYISLYENLMINVTDVMIQAPFTYF